MVSRRHLKKYIYVIVRGGEEIEEEEEAEENGED